MKRKNFNSQRLIFLLAIASVLAGAVAFGARQKLSAIRDSVLGESLCSIPCWEGIRPGVSTSAEALQILQSSSLINRESIDSGSSVDGFGSVSWKWQGMSTESEARLLWSDDLVREIFLPLSGVSVNEMINRYGPPEKVEVISIGIPEEWEWGVTLYYSTVGLQIQINGLFGLDAVLEPADDVSFIILFAPSSIDERVSYEGYIIEDINIRDWKGYGNIADLYYYR